MTAPLTYAGYLRVDELLGLQTPRSAVDGNAAEHDEMLFIVIHQVYELWFKQLLHELDRLRVVLADDEPAAARARAFGTLRRMLTILKTLVAQVDVLETMTPIDFNSFRGRLESASGFQSSQFRELEFALGHKRPGVLEQYPPDSPMRARLAKRMADPALWDAFLAHVARAGHAVPADALSRDVSGPIAPSAALQELLIDVYHNDPPTRQLCELLVDLDEGLQEWRYRHVKMVQRTIGAKIGTGGSAGAEYLMRTVMTPLFPDLWEIRSRL